MVDFTLQSGYSFGTMLIVAMLACGLAGVFYYRAFGMLSAGKWQLLLALRCIAILIIILLLFRPIFSYHKDLEHKPACIILLDTSQSMSISDDPSGVTRFNLARGQIEKWCERLNDDFDLHLVAFAEKAQPLAAVQDLAGLTPDGKATSLRRALVAATKQVEHRKDVEAVILVSDGVNNAAGNPLDLAIKMGMTVHTVGVGASLRTNAAHRDLQMTGMDCPERLLLNNMAKIKASVEGIGMAGRVAEVQLLEDDQQIAKQELTIDDLEGSQEVTFDYRPTQKGRHNYTVKVVPQADEKITENNQRSTIAMVVEPGIRVLYIEGTLRAEYGAIVDRFLAKDPDLEFCALVQTRPNVFLKRSNIADLKLNAIPTDAETINKFDVFIIGDLDATYLKPNVQDLILKRVKDNGGLIMLGGYHSLGPGGYDGSAIGDALPAKLGGRDVGQVNDSFLPTLTPDGTHHPIFANIGSFFPTQQQPAPKTAGLPPLDGCTRVAAAKPGASILATFGTGAEAMPVLAVQPLEKGRTAIFCGDTTRNWQQGPRAMDQDSPFTRFWGQVVRWLAGRSTPVDLGMACTASTQKAYYEPEEKIDIAAIVRNQEGQGAADAVVTAKIREPSGRPDQVQLTAVPGPVGHFGGDFLPQVSGSYEIVVEAKVGQQTVAADKLVVEVGRPNLEFEKLDLDEKLLGQIAADAGGRYMHISTADHLIDQFNRDLRKKQLTLERELYWPPAFWTVFVVVISLEWILRKKYQLR